MSEGTDAMHPDFRLLPCLSVTMMNALAAASGDRSGGGLQDRRPP